MMEQLGQISNPLNTARTALGGAGTQTAALAFGGPTRSIASNTGATEEYDGSSWTTNPQDLSTARINLQEQEHKQLV
jgi:hypothetical protein